MTRPSLCFVIPYAHALYSGDSRGHGGAEVQQRLVCEALAERGWDVRILSYAPGPPREEIHGGIRFWTLPRPEDSGGRLRRPAMIDLWRGLARVNAGVYYQRCAGAITGVVGAFARRRKRPFIFSVANDRDLNGQFMAGFRPHERFLYRLGVRLATRIVVQTAYQAELLRERWGREGVLITSACRLPGEPLPGASERSGVLWVGNLLPKKRPQLVPRLAAAMPEVPITMIAPRAGQAAWVETVLAAARARPNLQHVDRVPYAEMQSRYRRAALLVSTSEAEGFANVFLEAWASGIPVVSFEIDPDGVIARYGLGACTTSLEETAAVIRRLLSDVDERKAIGERARAYVREHHSPAAVAARYEELLHGLTGTS